MHVCIFGALSSSSPSTAAVGEGEGKMGKGTESFGKRRNKTRTPQLPPAEEHLLLLRLPGCPHPQVAIAESQILDLLEHPFLPTLDASFQDCEWLLSLSYGLLYVYLLSALLDDAQEHRGDIIF
ncbi:uncharacterized protein LOC107304831 [Oryza brachyantha]|uniref:uncharacterized protein LOC107304831 n=1 Tax=Oryza brachyantha TaxID=4533 RepID=UPI0007766175|nr:uncharacterized protein LOC107304831 [Oryza brachyantha]